VTKLYTSVIEEQLVERLFRQAKADRWRAPRDRFVQALESSVARAFAGRRPDPRELERHLTSLHLEDLAIACACAAGDEEAWEHFVLTQRPHLYRSADAIDPSGGARELADALYADLFGLGDRAGERQSLFRYFHGRSSLTTWLRAVLAQRYVDRLRTDYELDIDILRLASELIIDGIVEPRDVRRELIARFAAAATKDRHFSSRRHGVPPV